MGNMGLPMAMNLARQGFQLILHDLDRSRADRLIEMGAKWAPVPAELAAASDVVITSLPGPPEVTSVMEGDHGVASAMRAGSTWIDMSTNDIDIIRRLAEALDKSGVRTLDAPVSGGVPRAWRGFVTIYVGGAQEDFERLRHLFEAIGDKIFYMGRLGNGQATKLASNMLSFVHHAALGEALVMGARAGIDLQVLREAILAGYGSSFACEEGAPLIFDGSYNSNFNLDLVMKDFGLARHHSESLGCGWRLIPETEAYYRAAHERYGGDAGMCSVVRLSEEAAGVRLQFAPSGTHRS